MEQDPETGDDQMNTAWTRTHQIYSALEQQASTKALLKLLDNNIDIPPLLDISKWDTVVHNAKINCSANKLGIWT